MTHHPSISGSHIAVLGVKRGTDPSGLRFAAQAIVNALDPAITLESTIIADDTSPCLKLPGGRFVKNDTLDAVLSALTLDRERMTNRIDRFGRFDETAIMWDTSTAWIDGLIGTIRKAGPLNRPETNRFSVHITHDVDHTTLTEPVSVLNALLGLTGMRRGAASMRQVMNPYSLLRECERLIEFELEQGIGARYFLMSGPYAFSRYGTRTDTRWSTWRTMAGMLKEAGLFVGLHGSYGARDRNQYQAEKDRLEQALGFKVTTHRNHYLRFDSLRIASQLEAAGFDYDFSIGYASRMGFRAGTARIHRLFDLVHNRESRLGSVPLLFMDSHLVAQKPAAVLPVLRAHLQEVKKANGAVALLFHPEVLLASPNGWPLFKLTIDLCRELGADLSGSLPPSSSTR